MSNACHVDTDLVRSTRLQAALDMGEILKPCKHLVMGHCGFSVVIIDCHLLPILWASPDRFVDHSLIVLQGSVNNRLITAGDGMLLELCRYGIVGEIILACNDDAGGVHIDPVDDSRAQNSVDPGEVFLTVKHQRIHQCPRIMSGSRMNHHPLRLIYKDHIMVLI